MSLSNKIYRWGIIGCGNISTDFANCLDKHPRAKIVACAARRLESAQKFASKFDISQCYDNYDSIANDKNVDIVYVGTIHPSHYKSVISCLNNKKAVLCEKPIGMNSIEASKMIEMSQKNKTFLMEGVWTRFFPAIKKIRSLIYNENMIGDPVSFIGDFGINMPTVEEAPRMWDVKLGGGGTLDLGIYVVAPLSLVFGDEYPSNIKSVGSTVNGVDSVMSAAIQYGDKQFASINCNMLCNTPEEHYIIGTKGRITVHAPAHAPTKFTLTKFGNNDNIHNSEHLDLSSVTKRDVVSKTVEEFALPKGFRYEFIFPNSEGFYYEISEVSECIDKGLIESPNYTHKEILVTNKIMDEIRKQIGVTYQADIDAGIAKQAVKTVDEQKE